MSVAFGQFRLRVPMLLIPVDNPSQPYYMSFVTLSYIVCCFLSFRARRLYTVHRHCRSAMGLIPHPAVIISAVRTRLASCRCVAVYFLRRTFPRLQILFHITMDNVLLCHSYVWSDADDTRFMSLFIYPTAVFHHAPLLCQDGFLRAYRACFMRIVTFLWAVHTFNIWLSVCSFMCCVKKWMF